ncbi:hypothetical protein GGI42DRAFT_262608 [Trichoderma sp. SZMC 28013]
MPKKARHRCTNATHSSWHHTTASSFFSSFVFLSPSLCGAAPLLLLDFSQRPTSTVSSRSKSSHRGSSVTAFFFSFSFFIYSFFFLRLSRFYINSGSMQVRLTKACGPEPLSFFFVR